MVKPLFLQYSSIFNPTFRILSNHTRYFGRFSLADFPEYWQRIGDDQGLMHMFDDQAEMAGVHRLYQLEATSDGPALEPHNIWDTHQH
jgi:hypothetical protein